MSISANQRGILAICGSMVAYTVNDAMVKEIARSHPVGEVIFIRGLFTTLLIGSIVVALGYAGELRRALSRPVILRSLCDGLSTACFVVALVHMKLADLAAVLQVAPLILAAFSVLFYRETVGWRRWTAIIVGFIGTCSSSSRRRPPLTSGQLLRSWRRPPRRCARRRPGRSTIAFLPS